MTYGGTPEAERLRAVHQPDPIRLAFRILTRLPDGEVDAFARRLIEADARTVTPFLPEPDPIGDALAFLDEALS